MILAKNNIIVELHDSDGSERAILNPLSGSFDIMNESEYKKYIDLGNKIDGDPDFTSYLLERGYVYNDIGDYDLTYNKAYKEFKNESADAQVQLMLIPTYGCNLACTYCFQQGIDGRPFLISKEIVDAFFSYARSKFADAKIKPFITLFGGEPLSNSTAQREIINYIVDGCINEDYELAVVTNGYDFAEFTNILKDARIKEIQFTLDGARDVHDRRRWTANEKGSFDRVVSGIEAAVAQGFPVNLRSVVDGENIEDLVNLAKFLDEKGWLDLPPTLFKTQIGRNYELFECYEKPEYLLSQVELWGKVAELIREYPILAKLHRPDFKGIRYLVDTGELCMPSFDTCPAAKTEWVFDLYGEIYGCTATCGRQEYKLGTFWPEISRKQKDISGWQHRDVKNIEACKSCKYDVVCGGGCGVVAAGKNGGDIFTADCRPIQELYEIGINYYADEIRNMTKEDA